MRDIVFAPGLTLWFSASLRLGRLYRIQGPAPGALLPRTSSGPARGWNSLVSEPRNRGKCRRVSYTIGHTFKRIAGGAHRTRIGQPQIVNIPDHGLDRQPAVLTIRITKTPGKPTVVLTLTPAPDGGWSGEITDEWGVHPVTMRRN